MPLPPGLRLYITSADGTRRRRLPLAQVETVSTTIDRFGGYGQGTVGTAIPYQKAGSLTILSGDRVETWYQGQRRYRGYVSAIQPSGEEPRKVVLTTFGAAQILRKQFTDKAYAFPSGGVDVSAAFAQIAHDYLLKATGPGGFQLIQSAQMLPIGTTLQSLDARRKLAGDVLDALVREAGNLAVWGVDVDPAGNNRLYLRPLSPASPPTHAIPVPGRIVEAATGEQQTADLINQLLITGGSPTYPNLLHNGSFELPVQLADGAGNLLTNGSFDSGIGSNHADSWTLNNGAAANTPFSFPPKQAAAFTGARFLQLESTSQSASQTGPAAFVAGHNYTLSVRAAKEIDQQTATGHATLQVTGSGGAVLLTQTLALTPVGQGFDYFSATFAAPAGGAGFTLSLACDTLDASHVANNPGYPGGLIIDDVQLYDVSVVYQDGWGIVSADASAAYTNAVNWVYQDSVFEGGYCVYVDAASTDVDGHDLKLEPLATSRFQIASSQTLRYGVWLKSPPASQNPNPPKFALEIRCYGSDGSLKRTPRTFFTPGFLPNWTYFELVEFTLDGEVSADANITWRSAGSLLVDAQSVRDAQAPAMAGGNGSTTPLAPWLPDGPLTYFIRASDAYLNGTWRPGSGLSNPAPYAGSEAAYGPRCGTFSDPSILRLEDAMAVANGTFTAQAAPLYRPSVTLVNDPRLYWPGETVSLIGSDGPALSPTALPIARVVDTYDGLLKTRLEDQTEQPDVSLAVKKIVQNELRRLGPGLSGGGSGGGYSSASGGGGGGAATSPAYRATLAASATDPTLHDAYTGAPHASAASQAGWTATTSEVVAARTRTVKGVSATTLEGRLDAMEADIATGGGSVAPATSSSFGTVETDITQSGGSVVYTKTTADGLFATQASLSNEATARANADSAEVTARNSAINSAVSTEATARSNADSAEATARANGDAASLQTANNLSELSASAAASAARGNLGLGSAAVANLPTAGSNASASQVVRGDDTRLGAGGTGATLKRRAAMTFRPQSATPDTAYDLNQAVRLPSGSGGASSNWKLMKAVLRVESPTSSATSVQLYSSNAVGSAAPGNASFGTGAAFFTSPVTTGTGGNWEASGMGPSPTPTSGLTTTGLPSDTILAPKFTALGGSQVSFEVEFEEV